MNAPEKGLAAEPMILRRRAGAVETVILNRAAQYNSIPGAMIEEIRLALEAIARDANGRRKGDRQGQAPVLLRHMDQAGREAGNAG